MGLKENIEKILSQGLKVRFFYFPCFGFLGYFARPAFKFFLGLIEHGIGERQFFWLGVGKFK